MSKIIKIKSIKHLTHDVLRVVLNKPTELSFIPGQAVDISLNKEEWKEKKNCFTFTSLPEDEDIEFTIKTYPEHKGMTNELLSSKPGDEMIVYEPFGDIKYKGNGIFIAGGAGITPFIAILKDLEKKNKVEGNKVIFANKYKADIILVDWFDTLLGKNFINVLSKEEINGYEFGYITPEIIQKHSENNLKYYYLCGPPPMMKAVEDQLNTLGVAKEFIIKESF